MMNKLMAACAVLVIAVVAAGWHAAGQASLDFNQVALAGDLDNKQRDRVLQTLAQNRRTLRNIDDIQAVLGELEWVHHVEILRRWPDSLVITVVPERPIAYWNDDAFINAEGKVFASDYVQLGRLVQLYGPPNSEHEVMSQYQVLAKALSRVGLAIETLSLDARRSWSFETDTGIQVMLGNDAILERVQRFLFVFESTGLLERMDEIERIDTRYPNGLAVSWENVAGNLAMAKTNNPERERL